MSSDISPSTRPFQAKLRESGAFADGLILSSAASSVSEYVDVAKRILLEHRVRDFTAADVVALTDILERRDRYCRQGGEGEA